MAEQFLYCVRRFTGGEIHCILSFAGRIDEQRLWRAARLTLDAHPILGCDFVPHWFRPYWKRRTDLDQRDFCELMKCDDSDTATMQFLTSSAEPTAGPQVRLMLLRGVSDTLVIKFNHMIGDAASLAEYSYLLGDIYGQLKSDPTFAQRRTSPAAGA